MILVPHPSADKPDRSALPHAFAASGGVVVPLDWPALTPALIEIRLLIPLPRFTDSMEATALSWYSRLGRVVAVESTPTGALSAGVPHGWLSDA